MAKGDLFALLTSSTPMSKEEIEIRAWLKLNKETLEKYDPFEVLKLALQNDFSESLAYAVIVNFKDAMAGTQIENRAALHYFSFSVAMEDRARLQAKLDYVKELDLKPLWKELYGYQTAGECEEDIAA